MQDKNRGFTLIELLVVIAIIAILAAIIFPVLTQAKNAAQKTVCISNMKQVSLGIQMYMADNDDRLPDRRDLKHSLPGGYRPWTTWPPSDPRAGWAAEILDPYIRSDKLWRCPTAKNVFKGVEQVEQEISSGAKTYYWMWRFDRAGSSVTLDNLWGKTPEQAVQDLIKANNQFIGIPEGVSDVEILVDAYFPNTVSNPPQGFGGRAVHFGGRNRGFLDGHAKFKRDPRTE